MRLFLAVILTGSLVGLLGALFLIVLRSADWARIAAISLADEGPLPSWLVGVVGCLCAAALAAWLSQRFAANAPQTAEADMPSARPSSGASTFLVNFAGSSLAIGAGLALGPERPAIQMGGVLGKWASRAFGLAPADRDLFIAAAGGAGVATMFNSPLGCAAYTVEVVLKRVDFRVSAMTIGMGGTAVAVARIIGGRSINFEVETLMPGGIENLALFALLGGVIAILAHLHVHLIMLCARVGQTMIPQPTIRAATIGGIMGLVAWRAPELAGTGERMTQSILDGQIALLALGSVFLLRFVIGPFSLGASTPGGYFTPVLLLGASIGAIFDGFFNAFALASEISPAAFAVTGMAVALAYVASAPFTGILLVIETTGAFALSLPMTVAVVGAVGVSHVLKTPPLSHGLEVALHSHSTRAALTGGRIW